MPNRIWAGPTSHESFSVAETWARNGVRLKDAVKLAEEALDEISLGPEVMSDLTAPPNAAKMAARQMFGFDTSTWDAMAAIVDGAAQLKDLDKAGSMLQRMQQWLDDNQAKKDDPTSGYAGFQGRYFRAAGEIAEAKGNKLDAAGFYAKSISVSYRDTELTKRALALWEEAGGSKEVWEAFAARPAAPKPAAAKTSAANVATALEFTAWQRAAQPLPEMNLQDLLGKSWTLASLKGKSTFVNVWATYCAPCMEELPYVQKLYELSLNHDGVQVITFNVDENPGEAGAVHEVAELYIPCDHRRPKVCGGRHGAFLDSDELDGGPLQCHRREKQWIRIEARGLAEADGRKTRCAELIPARDANEREYSELLICVY